MKNLRSTILIAILGISTLAVKLSAQENTSPVSKEFLSQVLMSKDEKQLQQDFISKAFKGNPPFSFVYNGVRSADLVTKWARKEEIVKDKDGSDLKRITWTDDKTKLQCWIDVKQYVNASAVEWTVRFKNTGKTETPIIENIQAIDYGLYNPEYINNPKKSDNLEIHYSKGSRAQMEDFRYGKDVLKMQETLNYYTAVGKSSVFYLPFFNIKKENNGIIMSIGWTGQWACSFTSKHWHDTLQIVAGMEKTRLKLLPGEEIRTPKISLFFWKDDMTMAYNKFRRFMLNNHVPKQNGMPINMPVSCPTWGGMKEASHLALIKAIKDQKLAYDVYWIDAGWYGPKHETEEYQDLITNDWYFHVGNWNFNPTVVSKGFKTVSEAAHKAGMKLLVWFEPERAIKGTPFTKEHPEWFLKLPDGRDSTKEGVFKGLRQWILNLGDPQARINLTNFISNFIKENGVDVYRQDFNIGPVDYWRNNDAQDRQGITEIKYVDGLYAYWDELLKRHPGLYIDNCASGGMRIDLETLDRSISLSRTDYSVFPESDPVGGQIGNLGLMHWVPLHSTLSQVRPGDTYNFNSDLSAGIGLSVFDSHGIGSGLSKVPDDFPFDWHKKMMENARRAKPFFYGDYYPLLDAELSQQLWSAYQMDRPDLNQGMVMIFRRIESPYVQVGLVLKGIDPKANYEFENAMTGEKWKVSGGVLTTKGLPVKMENTRESQLLFYKKSTL